MPGASPTLRLNHGVAMPALGLGVFLSPRDQTAGVVASALGLGYRLIDTAAAYGNEREVGEGVRRSGIPRSEVFVTTKLWMTDYGYDPALRGFDVSLRKLGFDYLDLYLLHWPVPTAFDRTLTAWQALEQLLAGGRVRAIGVCNFSPAHLDRLLARAKVVPAVNQVELNPFFTQPALRAANHRLGIVTQSWSPIGGAYGRNPSAAPKSAATPLQHPAVLQLAAKYKRTPAQIVLRWHLDHGLSAIPKSVRSERMAENFNVFDFGLSADEMAAVDALDTGVRAGANPELVNAQTFPVTIEE
jgi:diketogulonate reductase-like aldo/keto reductase